MTVDRLDENSLLTSERSEKKEDEEEKKISNKNKV